MQKINWSHQCYYCHLPITRGRPTLILAKDKPNLLGISHSTCCATKYQVGHYRLCPPDYLSSERLSFWMHFYPLLYRLPSGALRSCLVQLLYEAPDALDNPIKYLRKYQDWNRRELHSYESDLENDFLKFLGQVQRMSKEKPVDVEVDFRRINPSK
jgi:hypothetical protein